MDTTTWVIIVVAVAAVLLAIAITATMMRRRERRRLRDRFGPEYDRAVDSTGGRRAAERDLAERIERRDEAQVRALDDDERDRFRARWARLQASFVDDPSRTAVDAEWLAGEVMRTRGYPADGFTEAADLLSVDHPDMVQDYRTAHECTLRARDGDAGTEECRQAVLRLRDVFDTLVDAGRTEDAERRRDGARIRSN